MPIISKIGIGYDPRQYPQAIRDQIIS